MSFFISRTTTLSSPFVGHGHLNWLRNEFGTTPKFLPSFLEISIVFPDEVYNYKIASCTERGRQFHKKKYGRMEIALNILSSYLVVEYFREQVLDVFFHHGYN